MRNHASSFRNSGLYTSPCTPEYGPNSIDGIPKAWSSERVPLPAGGCTGSQRHASALMPFSSGRAPPSKWDDAERWITSPVSGYGGFLTSPAAHHHHHHHRPKSKSGPLGPTRPGAHEGGLATRFAATNSPLSTGALAPNRFPPAGCGGGPGAKPGYSEVGDSRLKCDGGPGLLDSAGEGPPTTSRDSKLDGAKEDEGGVSRRDMATQMSPRGSNGSSSNPTCAKDEMRDVRVDSGGTIPKKKGHKKEKKGSSTGDDLNSWGVAEPSKIISKLQREEAKITAWENLQKAKAEAAIRKLEMKVEKKRSASMDKITNKLKAAKDKARAMRELLSDQTPAASGHRFCIYVKICSSCTCFLCSKR